MSVRIPNPQTKTLRQLNTSDLLGDIWSSCNLNLTENLGRIRVSNRGLNVGSIGTSLVPIVFQYYDGDSNSRIWCIAGTRMYYNSGAGGQSWVQDATASTPTNLGVDCDMELFNNALYICGNGDIRKYNGAWSTVSTAPNGGPCSMCVFGGRLYFTQSQSQIGSMSIGEVVVEPTSTPNTQINTLDLADFGSGATGANTIMSIRASSNRIWIATIDASSVSTLGRSGKIFEWDGVNPQANKVYYLDSIGAMALIIKGDIPYAVDANGRLLQFNGREFVEIARLPIPPQYYLIYPNPFSSRWIYPRGISIRNNRILLLVGNNDSFSYNTSAPFMESLPTGIWEYDENIGLYHRYSPSLWQTGVTVTRSDYSHVGITQPGAIYNVKPQTSPNTNGDLMWGQAIWNGSTYIGTSFFNDVDDTISKMGYFVTTKIDSQNIEDRWLKVILKHKKFLSVNDKIVLKYRTDERASLYLNITWTSTTTFTNGDSNLSAFVIGDEIEILSGPGGGQIETITSIVNNAGTYTVTLENAVTGATGIARARAQKWIVLGVASTQGVDHHEFPIGISSSWIQFKCIMYFTGNNELNELELINSTHLPSV